MFSNHFSTSILPISATDLKRKLQHNSLIVDTRFIHSILKTGSIPNVIFIGIQGNLEGWAHVLVEDKTVETYLIIEENIDINELYLRFQRAGFTNIKAYLAGGMESWIQENFPVEPYQFINPSDFINKMDQIDFQTIIDVRTEREFQQQHIKGSKNIPIENLIYFLDEFNPKNQYYIICQGGYRSIIAASILKRNGIHHTIDMIGGIKNLT